MSEMFGSTIEDKAPQQRTLKFRKTEFISMGQGEHLIRILDPVETKKTAHYVGWTWLECLGDACPICENNRNIMYENPNNFRDVKGWTPRRDRYFINVFDKTPAKVCEKCGAEAKIHNELCPTCQEPLGEARPLNKVKVLSRGPTLFEDLKVLARAERDDQDNIVDIRSYDWVLIVRGEGRDTTVTPKSKYRPDTAGIQDIGEQQLFDLDSAMVKLSPEEMLDVFNGASLKDVFTLRRAKDEVLKKVDVDSENVRAEIQASVDEIFKAG